jgi:C-3',4' desaturase CrtD
MFDVAVIGAGVAGMATAARLRARGLSVIAFEVHGQAGGCAGFFRRRGFAFDVGATTLVDFEPGGGGGQLLESIGMAPVEGEHLPGYRAWLPDRVITLHRDPAVWAAERLRALGDSPAHRRFWRWLDRLAEVGWRASRAGVKLPIQGVRDLLNAVRCFGPANLPLARFLRWTVGDALRSCGLRGDRPLAGLLSMLLEDTVHARLDDAPLLNGALGVTIRGAGLTRARGGMYGFWRRFVAHFQHIGGFLRVGCPVHKVEQGALRRPFRLHTRRGVFEAVQVVSAVPTALTARLGPSAAAAFLRPYLRRDADARGGACIVFLGVPEEEVAGQAFTHHQLLHDYDGPLGYGNNMFVSVSAPGDTESAPPGFRAVMISTHCELKDWGEPNSADYEQQKSQMCQRLIDLARRVYPNLGRRAVVREAATPRTYERFTRRPDGAVGGVRQNLGNTNQHALPYDLGVPGFWQVGDTTWPGLGTVACVLGSRLAADAIFAEAGRRGRISESRRLSIRPVGVSPCLFRADRPGSPATFPER